MSLLAVASQKVTLKNLQMSFQVPASILFHLEFVYSFPTPYPLSSPKKKKIPTKKRPEKPQQTHPLK